jgi:hypothetical protein
MKLSNLQTLARNIDPRIALIIVVALAIFMSGSSAWFSKAAPAAAPTPTLISTPMPAKVDSSALPSPTPFPNEYLNNEEQTIGPTVAASLLVLVVTVGVLVHFLRRSTP